MIEMMTVHAVLAVDVQNRVVGAHYAVPHEDVLAVLDGLRQHVGPDARLLVDGRDVTNQAQMVTPPGAVVSRKDPADPDLAAAQLGHHILWESYERAASIQAAMADRMIGQSVEMTRRFAEEMEAMRGRYAAALQQIDGIAFEQRMFEHERSYRHIAMQHRQLAEDERRATTRTDIGGLVEQLVVGAVRVIKAIGDEEARCNADDAQGGKNS
jgi:hypothetical protein